MADCPVGEKPPPVSVSDDFACISGKCAFAKKQPLTIDSIPSPSYSMFEMTSGSFHVVVRSEFLAWSLPVMCFSSVFPRVLSLGTRWHAQNSLALLASIFLMFHNSQQTDILQVFCEMLAFTSQGLPFWHQNSIPKSCVSKTPSWDFFWFYVDLTRKLSMLGPFQNPAGTKSRRHRPVSGVVK